MRNAATHLPVAPSLATAGPDELALPSEVRAVYEEHFDFVWRNARRLGVPTEALDDVVQDVFVVVCRRLADFEARSSVQTWLFGILTHLVSRHHRTTSRRDTKLARLKDASELAEFPAQGPTPHELAARRQAAGLLYELLAALDEDKRTAFILVELEQQAPLEVAELTGVNINTIHARVRAARQQIELGISRHRARENWRAP